MKLLTSFSTGITLFGLEISGELFEELELLEQLEQLVSLELLLELLVDREDDLDFNLVLLELSLVGDGWGSSIV